MKSAANRRNVDLRVKLAVAFTVAAACAFAQYGGPSVLSRGAMKTGQDAGLPLGFRYYAGVTGIYDNGLQPVSVGSDGKLVSVDNLYGVEAQMGVTGIRRWAHALLDLNYTAAYRHYNANSYLDGTDQILALEGQRQ